MALRVLKVLTLMGHLLQHFHTKTLQPDSFFLQFDIEMQQPVLDLVGDVDLQKCTQVVHEM